MISLCFFFNQFVMVRYELYSTYNSCFNCSYNEQIIVSYKMHLYFHLFTYTVIWLIVEFLRIPHGIKGNKLEDISRLSESFYLTICPQCLILTYLSFLEPYVFSVERLLGILQLCMLISQLIFGFQTIMKMIHYKSQSNLWDDMKIHSRSTHSQNSSSAAEIGTENES